MTRTYARWIPAIVVLVAAVTPTSRVHAQVGKGLLDTNTASEKDLLALPHLTPAIVKATS